MEDIKFRAFWPKASNKKMKFFTPGEFFDTVVNGYAMTFIQSGEEQETIFLGPAKIMQYITKKDKKGNDIYDGDILRWTGKDDNLVVEWGGTGWVVRFANGKPISEAMGVRHYFNVEFSDMLVIGNIYQNPDLVSPIK